MTARRAGTTAVAAVVATALLVIVLGAWAASIGPSEVLTGPGPSRAGTPTFDDAPSRDAGALRTGEKEDSQGTPGWVRTVAFLVDVAAALLVGYLLLRYVGKPLLSWSRTRRRRLRSGRRGNGDEADFAVLEPPAAIARAMLEDAEQQRRALIEADTPRNAVVACWHRFEAQAAAAGVERHPWETSSEYTMRVLDLVDAHQPAVSRLGSLYREARFSEHEVTEAHRQEALAALDTIHRTVGLPA
ncbi:DUF4129 domain-containing protein [Nocardioides sp. URHA0032]|uniref:DUF4129 domain-containing protein n=1 Tax=Nocardioides sp. URHA0032 TaxID=1380388 RepID=UPI0009E04FC6|nr:DUF4129 domain-containing protein [Nocardioides sp. URHA0032]